MKAMMDTLHSGPYTKRRKRVSTVPNRLLACIAAQPGLQLSEAARLLVIGHGTLRWHVGRLEKQRRLRVSRGQGRTVLLYPAGTPQEDALTDSILARSTPRRIAAFIHAHPGVSSRELGDALELEASLTYYHLRRLISAGLLLADHAPSLSSLRPTERLGRGLQRATQRSQEVP